MVDLTYLNIFVNDEILTKMPLSTLVCEYVRTCSITNALSSLRLWFN